MGGTVISRQ